MAIVKVSEDVESELAKIIQEEYDNCKDETFYVGLSGGSFPALLIKSLKKLQNIDWKKWLFFFCDERCVPSADPESTFGTFKKLLSPIDASLPISLSQFVTIDPALKSTKVAEDYVSKMRQRFDGFPKFNIVFLGLGPDGHTCSLFPDHRLLKVSSRCSQTYREHVVYSRSILYNPMLTQLSLLYMIQETTKWVAYIGDSPKPPPERITMTLPILNNSKLALFVVTGEAKAQVVKDILTDKKQLPAALVKPNQGTLMWLLDKAAGSKINV